MAKVTITKITRTKRTSNRTGKEFVSLGLKTAEYGERWLSGFAEDSNAHWKEGDQVEIEIEEKGEYLNFKTPKAPKIPVVTQAQLSEILTKLGKIDYKMDRLLERTERFATTSDGSPMPNFEPKERLNPEDDVPPITDKDLPADWKGL